MKALLLRLLSRLGHELMPEDSQSQILELVNDDGSLTPRYLLMVLMSCGIAILGLLQNSPAVIIGAMLISPLMGPIMLFGFALCTVDYRLLKKALAALLVGTALGIGFSMVVVLLSPLTDPTSELLARTQPNLFDLLVAVFSGLAGAYATIRGKGAAIVGVAIATALMPPLATVGYGLAMGNIAIAKGASLLFFTNLLAIALSVTAVGRWFGFGMHNHPRHLVWQTLLTGVVFAALSIPLGVSLKRIASEALVTRQARSTLTRFVAESDQAQIERFVLTQGDPLYVSAVVYTRRYEPNLGQQAEQRLSATLGRPVQVHIDQIMLAKEEPLPKPEERPVAPVPVVATLPPMVEAAVARLQQAETAEAQFRRAFPYPARDFVIDVQARTVLIEPQPQPALELADWRRAGTRLAQDFPDWAVTLVPPAQALPSLYFEQAATALDADGEQRLADILWGLRLWQARDLEVLGYASLSGKNARYNNARLAAERAETVAARLRAEGYTVTVSTATVTNQVEQEREYGVRRFQRVDVRLLSRAEPPETEPGPAGPDAASPGAAVTAPAATSTAAPPSAPTSAASSTPAASVATPAPGPAEPPETPPRRHD